VKTLREIVERSEQRRERLKSTLPRVVEQLEAMGALKVILFGSLARGDTSLWSDLDIIAIMPPPLSSSEWMQKIYTDIDRGISCDILAYSERDLQKMLPISSFLRHALKEGKVIYEATGTGRSQALADPS
jgi:predicted nucleotidyltransferase